MIPPYVTPEDPDAGILGPLLRPGETRAEADQRGRENQCEKDKAAALAALFDARTANGESETTANGALSKMDGLPDDASRNLCAWQPARDAIQRVVNGIDDRQDAIQAEQQRVQGIDCKSPSGPADAAAARTQAMETKRAEEAIARALPGMLNVTTDAIAECMRRWRLRGDLNT